MTTITADSREAIVRQLSARALGLDAAIVARLADALVTEERSPGMGLVAGRFVIRGDDLNLFDSLVGAVSAAVPAMLATGGSPGIAVASALLGGLAKTLRDLATKGKRLRPAELELLLYLRVREAGATVAEMVRDLPVLDGEPTDAPRVQALLGELANVLVAGGGTRAFVTFDAGTEVWRAVA